MVVRYPGDGVGQIGMHYDIAKYEDSLMNSEPEDTHQDNLQTEAPQVQFEDECDDEDNTPDVREGG
jgi:hypothetical protein